jgi:hypothetical protein
VVFFLFLCYITVTLYNRPSFFTGNIASQTSKRHLSACNIWTFSRRFSRNLIPRHIFDVKTCLQQNRYVFDVIVTSWALFVFCISWNFARDISTVFEEIKHLRSITVTLYNRPSFFTGNIASQTSKRHLSACNIWTFSRRFSRNLIPRAPKKYFPGYWGRFNGISMLLLKWSKIVWSKRSRYLLGTIEKKIKYSRQAAYKQSMEKIWLWSSSVIKIVKMKYNRIDIKWRHVSSSFKIYLEMLSHLYIMFTIFYYNTISIIVSALVKGLFIDYIFSSGILK